MLHILGTHELVEHKWKLGKHIRTKAQSSEATHLFHLIDKLFSINAQQHNFRNRISKYHPYKCLDFICMAITLIDFLLGLCRYGKI